MKRRRAVKRAPRRVPKVESKLINSRGGSREWSKIAKDVAAKQPVCWLQLPGYCTRRSQTADHYYPRKSHPHLAEVRSNLRGACIPCNRRRRDTPPHLIAQLRLQCAAEKRKQPPKRPSALGFFD